MPVMIPDRDDLHADLCAPQYKYDSNSRRKLESKDEIEARVPVDGLRRRPGFDFAEPLVIDEFDIEASPTVVDKVAGYKGSICKKHSKTAR